MKRKIYATLLLSTLLLAGCQDAASTSEVPENTDTTEQEEPTTEQTNETPEETEDSEDTESTEDTESSNENFAEETTPEEPEEVVYKYQINPNTFSVEPINPEEHADEKLVLLTYDDAPYGNSMDIAKALDERGVGAIFFVNGMYMEDDEGFETIQEVHEMGFEIANHTHTHATLPDYAQEDQRAEIIKTSDIIEEAIGERPRFFRAPHGMMTEYSEQVVFEEGMTWMNWSFGYDWMPEYQDASALTDITLKTELLGNGTNILMHDRTWTAEATPAILDGLIDQGFTIVDPKLISHEQ